MRPHRRKETFFQRHLDPASRLSEVLFGLIMMLTVTLTASVTAKSGEPGARRLLVAAVSCNIAWGIIDGVMYIMNGFLLTLNLAAFVYHAGRVPYSHSHLSHRQSNGLFIPLPPCRNTCV
jgi:hypothetical protein